MGADDRQRRLGLPDVARRGGRSAGARVPGRQHEAHVPPARDRRPPRVAQGAGRLGPARRRGRAEGGARGHGRGVGPLPRTTRSAAGTAPARGTAAGSACTCRRCSRRSASSSWSTTRRTTGSARGDPPAVAALPVAVADGALSGSSEPHRASCAAMTSNRPRPEPAPTAPVPDPPRSAPSSPRKAARRAGSRSPRSSSRCSPSASPSSVPSCRPAAPASRRRGTCGPTCPTCRVGYTLSASQYDINRQQVTFLGPLPADETSDPGRRLRHRDLLRRGRGRRGRALGAGGEGRRPDRHAARRPRRRRVRRDRRGRLELHPAAPRRRRRVPRRAPARSIRPTWTGSPPRTTRRSAATAARSRSARRIRASRSRRTSSRARTRARSSRRSVAVAPELEAKLPAEVDGTVLTIDSAVGTDVLGEDQSSRAITAALRAAGKTARRPQRSPRRTTRRRPPTCRSSRSRSMACPTRRPAASSSTRGSRHRAPGVTKSDVQLGGTTVTRIDYGDGGTKDYVVTPRWRRRRHHDRGRGARDGGHRGAALARVVHRAPGSGTTARARE